MKYKPSKYNIYVPTGKKDELVLYNSLHDSIMLIDGETKEIIENNIDMLGDNEKKVLNKMGIILDSNIDELRVLKLKYNRTKYNTSFYSLFVILPTFACNLACNYCYEGSGEVMNDSMSNDTLKRVISFIKQETSQNKSKEILMKIYGGEPLLNYPVILKLCTEIYAWTERNDIGFNLILQTNGTLLNEERIKQLKPFLDGVELTFDGPKERHDRTRVYKKGGGTYDKIIENIDILLENMIPTIVRLNVENADELTALFDDFTKRGYKGKTNFLYYTARISDYSLCQFFSNAKLCHDDQERALELAPDLHQVMVSTGWKPQHRQVDVIQKQKFVACNNEKAGRYTIDPLGNVYTCFFRAGDEKYKAGTLTDNGVEWTPIYYNMITRDATSFKECQQCKFLPFCGGGCSMRAYDEYGTFDHNHCGSLKELMPKRILLYLQKNHPEKFA